MMTFEPFPKIARLNRDCVITEKVDGTNAAVVIVEGIYFDEAPEGLLGTVVNDDGGFSVFAQSRKRLISTGKSRDNFGFAAWVQDHADELVRTLGVGRHYGEWWGQGIQRGYGLDEKRFSLFKPIANDPTDVAPAELFTVPLLYQGPFSTDAVASAVSFLRENGSQAAPGFMQPEGVVVWHEHARQLFKVTLDNDELHKGQVA